MSPVSGFMQILEMTIQCPLCEEQVILDMTEAGFVAEEEGDGLVVAMVFKCPACNETVGPVPIGPCTE